jgi:hypothetical protein
MRSQCLTPSPHDDIVDYFNQIRKKLYMCIMAPEHKPTAYFIHLSLQSVCLFVSQLSLVGKGSVKCTPPFIARQRSLKYLPAATSTQHFPHPLIPFYLQSVLVHSANCVNSL